jgi:hypothetical protein
MVSCIARHGLAHLNACAAVIEACGGMESTKQYGEAWWRMALGAHWQHGARLSGVGGEPALHAWIGGVGVKDYVRQSVTLGTCAVVRETNTR